jgi:hypothetical protein
MRMKKNSFLLYFVMGFALLGSLRVKSQLYRFKPAFKTHISYKAKKDSYTWVNGMLTRLYNENFIFDVDKKLIVRPFVGPADTLRAVAIERDEQNRRLIFRLQATDFKDFKERWSAYIIQFDSDGTTPLYFQQGNSLTEYHVKDSTLITYASDPGNFPYAVTSTGIKEDTTMSTGNREEKMATLFKAYYTEADNKLIMRPGYILWTKGKGRKATVKSFQVDSVRQVERSNFSGITAFCQSPGEPEGIQYAITYLYPKTNIRVHEVHIYRLRFGRMLSTTILKTY